MNSPGGWMCRDCGSWAPTTEVANGWIVILGVPIKAYVTDETEIKPWFVLCDRCCDHHNVPDFVRGKPVEVSD